MAINQGETGMKTTKLRLVSFGSAKALTRDNIQGEDTEMGVFPRPLALG